MVFIDHSVCGFSALCAEKPHTAKIESTALPPVLSLPKRRLRTPNAKLQKNML